MTAHAVSVRRGSIYIPRAAADRYFRDVASVIVLIREGRLEILPVRHAAAGGCLLKIRNAAGDRVAVAMDVFAENGLSDWSADGLPAQWSDDHATLFVELP